jgi:hypothetical protein
MSKTPAELSQQRDTDNEIMQYVRGMQQSAPVELETIFQFLTTIRRKRLTRTELQDRLTYLVGKDVLKEIKEWSGGEIRHWQITAYGMDVLDGNVPPDYWGVK